MDKTLTNLYLVEKFYPITGLIQVKTKITRLRIIKRYHLKLREATKAVLYYKLKLIIT